MSPVPSQEHLLLFKPRQRAQSCNVYAAALPYTHCLHSTTTRLEAQAKGRQTLHPVCHPIPQSLLSEFGKGCKPSAALCAALLMERSQT